VNVTNYNLSYDGFRTPCFFISPENQTGLLVGTEEGMVHYYNDIDNNLTGQFTQVDSLLGLITGKSIPQNLGWRSAVGAGYLTDPDYLDLVIGNYSGGLNYHTHQSAPGVLSLLSEPENTIHPFLQVYPVPADKYIVIIYDPSASVGLKPLQVFDMLGRIVMETFIQNKVVLNTSSLPQGTYLIRSGNHTQKLVILHP
jgi:hypothetical protein